ncbi:MAG: hypothetical protein A2Y58_02360 [Chloroflexi bacterium RBG_13_51_52]|nr:MAG: hypothetical protein A2Y58_02360 [Chloroflexi bacterium RBG_13_51_52]
MKQYNIVFQMITTGLLVILLLFTGCNTATISAPQGTVETSAPPVETSTPPLLIIATPQPPIKIIDSFVATGDSANDTKILPAVFPSGIKELYLVIIFEDTVPDGTRIKANVSLNNQTIELSSNGIISTIEDFIENTMRINIIIKPESDKFYDGSYQAIIKINDTPTIQLNWMIKT